MGKIVLVCLGIAFGYTVGFRDAEAHRKHVATRVVEGIRSVFHGRSGTDVDAMMTQLEKR